MKTLIDEFLDWVGRSPPVEWATREKDNLAYTLVGCAVVAFIGFLMIFGPIGVANGQVEKAEATIKTQQALIETAQKQLQIQELWFANDYVIGLAEILATAEDAQHLGAATTKLADAKRQFWPEEKYNLANEALNLAGGQDTESVANLVSSVIKKLTENDALRTNARASFALSVQSVTSSRGALTEAQKLFDRVAPDHLSKYVKPLDDKLKSVSDKVDEAQSALDAAQLFLPLDSTEDKSGDPKAAQTEIDKAKALIDEINVLAKEVTASLGELETAKRDARPTTDAAVVKAGDARRHIDDIVVSRGFSLDKALREADNLQGQATGQLQIAKDALAFPDPQEGKYDYLAAYNAAKQSLTLSDQAVDEADQQVAFFENATKLIAEFGVRLNVVNGLLNTADSSLRTLSDYHAKSVWNDVANNVTTGRAGLESAKMSIGQAATNVSLLVQHFSDADQQADTAHELLNQAEVLANAVINRSSSLEGFRAEWPGSESNAQNVINAQSGDIATYGGYDGGAASDYNQAVSLLNQARVDAREWKYEDAVNSANRARNLADGTGNRAYQAYESEMDRRTEVAYQETQQQEAADAASTAAAIVAEQSSSASSSGGYSSGGFDSGGSSWDSGSSWSSGDSGGWDSGGGYDGGGFDSGGGDDGGGW